MSPTVVVVAARAARTYLHALIGLLLAGGLDLLDIPSLRAAAVAALPAALSVLQNALEEAGVGLGPRG